VLESKSPNPWSTFTALEGEKIAWQCKVESVQKLRKYFIHSTEYTFNANENVLTKLKDIEALRNRGQFVGFGERFAQCCACVKIAQSRGEKMCQF
jgi:hypothetical protein